MTVETITFREAVYPEVTYSRTPFPVAVLDGKPWWSTAHVQHFLNARFTPEQCECFTSDHVGGHRFPFDAEDGMSHVLSTLAAAELAGRNPGRRANRMLAGWLRNRASKFRTAPLEPIGTLFRVSEDGPHPGRPTEDESVIAEWRHWEQEYVRQLGCRTPRTTIYC